MRLLGGLCFLVNSGGSLVIFTKTHGGNVHFWSWSLQELIVTQMLSTIQKWNIKHLRGRKERRKRTPLGLSVKLGVCCSVFLQVFPPSFFILFYFLSYSGESLYICCWLTLKIREVNFNLWINKLFKKKKKKNYEKESNKSICFLTASVRNHQGRKKMPGSLKRKGTGITMPN